TSPCDLHSFPTRRSSDLKCLLVPERAPDRVRHIGQVIGVDEILDTHLQQLRLRAPNDAAKSIVGAREAPCGVDLREAHHRLAERSEEHTSELQSRSDLVC